MKKDYRNIASLSLRVHVYPQNKLLKRLIWYQTSSD